MKDKHPELLRNFLDDLKFKEKKSLKTFIKSLFIPYEGEILIEQAYGLIKIIFGSNSEYLIKLKSIQIIPPHHATNMNRDVTIMYFETGKKELINLVNLMLEDIENLNSVFIVHGHNEELCAKTKNFIYNIGLKPIILHEQVNLGRTIIEKFNDYSNVKSAIIIISGDDFGYSKRQGTDDIMERARQNVIFEFGFFIGKLGRDKVIPLREFNSNIELPSDYQGVLYISIDEADGWKLKVLKELEAIGYNIEN